MTFARQSQLKISTPARRQQGSTSAARGGGLLALQRTLGNRYVQRKVGPGTEARLEAARGRGRPLDGGLREQMEAAFGADFGDVRVHTGADAARSASELGALAMTRGDDLHFAPGRYDPGSEAGQQLLGHELTHVVQQREGRVRVPQGKLTVTPAGDEYEEEADRVAGQVMRAIGPGRDGTAERR